MTFALNLSMPTRETSYGSTFCKIRQNKIITRIFAKRIAKTDCHFFSYPLNCGLNFFSPTFHHTGISTPTPTHPIHATHFKLLFNLFNALIHISNTTYPHAMHFPKQAFTLHPLPIHHFFPIVSLRKEALGTLRLAVLATRTWIAADFFSGQYPITRRRVMVMVS